MFKGAGGIELLARALSPILTPLHFPTDLLPIALMRPLSGGATLALFTDVVHRLGPEKIVSLMAATIYGSTRTTFYVASGFISARLESNKPATRSPREFVRRFCGSGGLGHCLPSDSFMIDTPFAEE